MRILISGANGFIGKRLILASIASGYEVVALTRSGNIDQSDVTCVAWELGMPIPEEALKEVSYAIHLAHDFNGAVGASKTVEGTLQIVAQLRAAGAIKQLFYSSYSAGEHAASLYGNTKYQIEQMLLHRQDVTIVRPGLVLGDSGIYGRIQKLVNLFPIIPLPDGGYGEVPIIGVDRLVELTLGLLKSSYMAEVNIFDPQFSSLRKLVLELSKKIGRKRIILNIPSRLIMFILKLLELLPVRLPVGSDNLQGFISNQQATHKSTIF